MRTTTSLFCLTTALAFTAAPAAGDDSLKERFYEAWHRQYGEGDAKGAAALYKALLEDAEAADEVAPMALMELARCHRSLGDTVAEAEALQRLLEGWPAHRHAAEARGRLRELGAAAAAGGEGEGQPYPWDLTDPDGEGAIRETLATRRVTLNFTETSLGEVLAFLADITGLNFVGDPRLDLEEVRATLRLRSMPLATALELIALQTATEFGVRNGVVYWAAPGDVYDDGAAAVREALARQRHREAVGGEREDWPAVAARRVSLNFDATPFPAVLDFLREVLGVDIVVSPAAAEVIEDLSLRVSLRLSDLGVENALALIVKTHGELTYRHFLGCLVVETALDAERRQAAEDAARSQEETEGVVFLVPTPESWASGSDPAAGRDVVVVHGVSMDRPVALVR
ncbi:MAG: hypothetical protein HY722_00720 [Planctomycetes bacterium]|nr:hypothetical protein [Planctomycetota bacterium]